MTWDLDVAIVGSGILGTLAAMRLGNKNRRIGVFRLSDANFPQAETLRNQAWRQSGLRYPHDLAFALRLWAQGRRLAEEFGQVGEYSGVFQFEAGAEHDRFLKLHKILTRSEAVLLESRRGYHLIGGMYKEGALCYETADEPINFANILYLARERARLKGVQFREIPEPIKLEPRPGETPSVRIRLRGEILRARVVILAAGIGNIALLKDLGIEGWEVKHTPTLVIPGPPLIRAGLLRDKLSGVNIVAPPDRGGRRRCMVIGVKVSDHWTDDPFEPRNVDSKTRDEILGGLPTVLRDHARRQEPRFTVGCEPGIKGARHKHVLSTVEPIPGHPDVFVGFPGRATLALACAEDIRDQVLPLLPPPQDFLRQQDAVTLPGSDWIQMPRMHYEYPSFCDHRKGQRLKLIDRGFYDTH